MNPQINKFIITLIIMRHYKQLLITLLVLLGFGQSSDCVCAILNKRSV